MTSPLRTVFVHERALCESDAVGPGTRIWAFAHVMAGAQIGEDCNIGGGAFVETGAVIGNRVTVKNNVLVWDGVAVEDDVFLGPAVVFTNDINPRAKYKKQAEQFVSTIVRRGASIGANATVVCGVTISEHAFVGAGAVVVDDVGAHALVVGNPAKQIGWVCECGRRLGPDLVCTCGRNYREIDGRLTGTGPDCD
jgi:acetyltransferase-like isoleucine patch superfamily enzyme